MNDVKIRILPYKIQLRNIKGTLRRMGVDVEKHDIGAMIDKSKPFAENKKNILSHFEPKYVPVPALQTQKPTLSGSDSKTTAGNTVKQNNSIQEINLKPEADKNMSVINPKKKEEDNECGECHGKFAGHPKFCPMCGVELEGSE